MDAKKDNKIETIKETNESNESNEIEETIHDMLDKVMEEKKE